MAEGVGVSVGNGVTVAVGVSVGVNVVVGVAVAGVKENPLPGIWQASRIKIPKADKNSFRVRLDGIVVDSL